MEMNSALSAFSALAQEPRLRAFRFLIAAGDAGVTAGEVAAHLDAPASTTSANLSQMVQAKLARNRREGRTIRYFADPEGISALVTFLLHDCCGNQPHLCGPKPIKDPAHDPTP